MASKKQLSEIERGAGFFAGLITVLMEVMAELKVPFEALHRLVTPEGRATVRAMIEVASAWYLFSRLEQMFDTIDPRFKSSMPESIEVCRGVVPEKDATRFVLVADLHNHAGRKEVLTILKKRNLRPALFEELLIHEKTCPSPPHPIIALGTVWRLPDGKLYSPRVGDNRGREINLSPCEHQYLGTRLLAVRQID